MPDTKKYDKILDALQNLLLERKIQNISVSEIAKAAGMGKGSLYYYFPSKEAILNALIERSYEQPIKTAKTLARQTEIPPFTRMAMIFQTCRNASASFLNQSQSSADTTREEHAFLIQKYSKHIIMELKPELTTIIEQGISRGEIQFEYPGALAEIVLIVLVVKLSNVFVPSEKEEIEETLRGLISLLEKGTGTPPGSLEYLSYPS
ncbi:MAG: TetR/AcrR family transcriptional regulator [Roseburia sp.]|nr:TetR/AcrR family transcriptional regulator [Roseburia sp.]